MSTLWWLEPGWKDATCPHCGVNIWQSGGDPDWGACFDCLSASGANGPAYQPPPPCDICKQYPAVASGNGYGVCSAECHNKAVDLATPTEAPSACPAEQWAFETFAAAHPHEAHAEWPERFWALHQRIRPGVSREEMERELAATETTDTEGA